MFIKNIERVRGGPKLDTAQTIALGLGGFSLALGAFQLAAPGRLAKWLGLKSHKPLLRGYGAREVATGAGILTGVGSHWFVWGRVAGDAADMATLFAGLRSSKRKMNILIALGSVAAVTALDVVCAAQLTQNRRQPKRPVRDYSHRSGFPRGVEAAYGVAARELKDGLDWWNAWRKEQGRGGQQRIEFERDDGQRRRVAQPQSGARLSPDYGIPAGRA
jgi:hypothetical protein